MKTFSSSMLFGYKSEDTRKSYIYRRIKSSTIPCIVICNTEKVRLIKLLARKQVAAHALQNTKASKLQRHHITGIILRVVCNPLQKFIALILLMLFNCGGNDDDHQNGHARQSRVVHHLLLRARLAREQWEPQEQREQGVRQAARNQESQAV